VGGAGGVFATGSGTVEFSGLSGGQGHTVSLRLDDGSRVSFAGLGGSADTFTGQRVSPGEAVGDAGQDGSITVKVWDRAGGQVDPADWFGLGG
jgi:murein DD-endopeptidase MepM/ murein hydrolase activator NlpD